MKTLLKRNLVHAARVSARGSEGWSLTPDGVEFARRLESNLAWYEAAMGAAVELPMVVWSLQRMVESLVNRPSANGWAGGLLVPAELRRSPDWALHLESAVLPEAGPPPKRRRRGVPAGHPNRPTWTQEEIDETAERWRALWRD